MPTAGKDRQDAEAERHEAQRALRKGRTAEPAGTRSKRRRMAARRRKAATTKGEQVANTASGGVPEESKRMK